MDFDYILLGGGLQNGLIALALRHAQPTATIALIEQAPQLGGNHTWCFHRSDVPADALPWLQPLIGHSWPGYDVHFAEWSRRLALPYCAVTSPQFAQVVTAALHAGPGALLLEATVTAVQGNAVALADGRTLHGRLIVDARGVRPEAWHGRAGWQKFLGLELELTAPHGLTQPILMDARVPQDDGFRFLYVLPFGPRRLLVEDTRFSDSPALDVPAARAQVHAYAARAGWRIAAELRQETGVLPMPWRAAPPELPERGLVAGMRGGWFHPATGYSLAVAARLAQTLATVPLETALATVIPALQRRHARQARFGHALNWALFHLAAPQQRNTMIERLYRRPEPIIRDFFALDLHPLDAARIVLGRPPRGMRWWPRTLRLEAMP